MDKQLAAMYNMLCKWDNARLPMLQRMAVRFGLLGVLEAHQLIILFDDPYMASIVQRSGRENVIQWLALELPTEIRDLKIRLMKQVNEIEALVKTITEERIKPDMCQLYFKPITSSDIQS